MVSFAAPCSDLDDPRFLALEIQRQLEEKWLRGYHATTGRCITVTSHYDKAFLLREVLPLLKGRVTIKENGSQIADWEFSLGSTTPETMD